MYCTCTAQQNKVTMMLKGDLLHVVLIVVCCARFTLVFCPVSCVIASVLCLVSSRGVSRIGWRRSRMIKIFFFELRGLLFCAGEGSVREEEKRRKE